MSAGPLSNSSSQIQPNAVPRTEVQDRPDVLALFHSSGGTAEKMSADRSNLIEVVTQAADASDRCRGNSRRPSSSEWSVVRSKMWSSEIAMPKVVLMVVLFGLVAAAQSAAPESPNVPAVRIALATLIWAKFTKSLDARRDRAGDPVEAKTSVDLLAGGKIVLPRNTKVLGHVTAAKPRTKDSPDSFIAIRLDRFVLRNGQEVPVTIVVQALSGPLQSFFNSKSSTEELSTALPPIGTSTTRATTLGDPSLGQIPGRQYPARSTNPSETVLTSVPGSGPTKVPVLDPASQGAIGLKGISLTSNDRVATISSSTQNLHIDSEDQLLLKTQ